MSDSTHDFDNEAVHGWFGLSYANYLTLPRSLMEAMPAAWQRRFVDLMAEMGQEFDTYRPELNLSYSVQARGEGGRFVRDPLAQYRRPDRALIESLRRSKDGTVEEVAA